MEFCLLARLLIHIFFFFLQDFWIQHSCIYLRWGVWENFQISREGMIAVSSLSKCRCDLQFIIWICDTLLDWIDHPYFSRLSASTEFLSQSQKLRSPQRMKPQIMGLAVRRKQMLPTHHLRRLPPPKIWSISRRGFRWQAQRGSRSRCPWWVMIKPKQTYRYLYWLLPS